jgi:hypothetical protein
LLKAADTGLRVIETLKNIGLTEAAVNKLRAVAR